jgi:hypothetical protein
VLQDRGACGMRKLLIMALMTILSTPVFATTPLGYVLVSGSNTQDSTGTLVLNATISFAPVNNNGAPISFRANGVGQVIDQPVTAQVTSGVFSIQLADTALTDPANVCYLVTIISNVSGKQLLGSVGYTSAPQADIQGKYTFGGSFAADQQDPSQPGYGLGYGIGPGGAHYDFSGLGYCEVRFGDQPPGDYMASLTYNDHVWPTTARVAGCAYIYLQIGYNVVQFPSAPEIRLTINGKNNIYDPRTSTYGFSTNWALQVADVISDPVFGLNDSTVNQAQLIAAANVCDEMILTSQGNEYQYSQHIHYDTSTAPGDALNMMMPAAKGRLSRVGGEWYIYPRYWQGPSFSFDSSTLTDTISWTPYRKYSELINCVNGTYIAPNYPYALVGNLYDTNGWYYGTINNLWPFAWQPTNFPQFACDVLHGFSSNQFLEEDGGTMLPKELTLRGVISVTQAQRLASLELLINRAQGSGAFPMSLTAWQMQPLDVMEFTFPQMGWSAQYLEVEKIQLVCEPSKGANGEDDALALSCLVSVVETAASEYEWSITEELTPEDVPAIFAFSCFLQCSCGFQTF